MYDLTDKKILITGGSRGIGGACAVLAAKAGADVAISYRHRKNDAADVVAEIEKHGRRGQAFRAELTDWDAAVRLSHAAAEALGGLDVVVNNAGVWLPTPAAEWSRAGLDSVLGPNLYGALGVTRGALDVMIPQGHGNIVFIASTAGQRGEPVYNAYAMSKGAVIALTKSLAPELVAHNIRVNCVAPGWVETEMSAEALHETRSDEIRAAIPVGRAARPEEIAACVLFLAADASSFVVGEILNANGGAVLCG